MNESFCIASEHRGAFDDDDDDIPTALLSAFGKFATTSAVEILVEGKYLLESRTWFFFVASNAY